jgi:hypothetical protein
MREVRYWVSIEGIGWMSKVNFHQVCIGRTTFVRYRIVLAMLVLKHGECSGVSD